MTTIAITVRAVTGGTSTVFDAGVLPTNGKMSSGRGLFRG